MSQLSFGSRSGCVRFGVFVAGVGFGLFWWGVVHAQPVSGAFMTDAPAALNYWGGHTPTAASDGNQTLVVFEESGSIHAARLDALGQPLDIEWLNVQPRSSEGDLNYYYPSLAYGGGRYLAAWSGTTLGARLIEPDGTLLPVIELGGNGLYPSIAWNGSAFVVAWMDVTDEGRDTMLAFIDIDGNVLSRTPLSATGDTSWPSIAAGDAMSIVAWENAPDSSTGEIYAARVSHDGTVLDPDGVRIAFSNQDRFVHTATSGQSFLVTWNEMTTPAGVMGTVITEDGTRSDTVRLNDADSSGHDFNVAFDGEKYAAVWLDDTAYPNTLWGINVSLDGLASEPVEVPSRDARANDPPHLLWTGDRYLLSYVGEGIVGGYLSGDLVSQEQDIPLSFIEARQDSANTCFDGTHYALSWTELRGVGPAQTVRNEQIGQNAQVLDAETLQLGTVGEEYTRNVALACAGQDSSLTAWSDTETETLYAQVRHADGSLGDVHTIASGAIAGPNLASNGESYLVTFLTSIAEGQSAMTAQFLELDGTPRGEPFDLLQTGVFAHGSLSAIGTGYLWYYDDNENTYLQPISATGELPEPILLDSGRANLATASNGSLGLIIYGKLQPDGETREQVLRFVSQNDWQAADIPLGVPASYVRATWDGTQFALLIQDDAYRANLYAVSAEGVLALQQEQLLTEESYVYGFASNAEGQLLLTYSRYVGEYESATRIFNRVIGDLVSVDLSDRVTPVPSQQPPSQQPPTEEPPTEPMPPVQGEPPSGEPPLGNDDAGVQTASDETETPDEATTDSPSAADEPSMTDSPEDVAAPSDADEADDGETMGDPTDTSNSTAMADASTGPVAADANDDDGGCSVASAAQRSSSTAWLAVCCIALMTALRRRKGRASVLWLVALTASSCGTESSTNDSVGHQNANESTDADSGNAVSMPDASDEPQPSSEGQNGESDASTLEPAPTMGPPPGQPTPTASVTGAPVTPTPQGSSAPNPQGSAPAPMGSAPQPMPMGSAPTMPTGSAPDPVPMGSGSGVNPDPSMSPVPEPCAEIPQCDLNCVSPVDESGCVLSCQCEPPLSAEEVCNACGDGMVCVQYPREADGAWIYECAQWSICESARACACIDPAFGPCEIVDNTDICGCPGPESGSFAEACDCAPEQVCILQQGGPGPAAYTCVTQDPYPCAEDNICGCLDAQGTCTWDGATEICHCDSGLD